MLRARTWGEGLWLGGGMLIAALVALPVVLVFLSIFQSDPHGTWAHLMETTLWGYLGTSVILVVGTIALAAIAGVTTAWLIATCDFPGRRALSLAMILPLAVPGYVAAYCWTDLLTFAGPVQTWLRDITGWQRGDYWFPDIASRGGAVLILASVLYPYVFLTARAAFLGQGALLLDAARTLGMGPWRAFGSVSLPLARPAIVAGMALVAMETLADFGAVDHLGIDTFTTAIYRQGIDNYDFVTAGRLAAVLVIVVFVVLGIERLGRSGRGYHQIGGGARQIHRMQLRGWRAAGALIACLIPLLAGAGIPLGTLVVRSWQAHDGLPLISLAQAGLAHLHGVDPHISDLAPPVTAQLPLAAAAATSISLAQIAMLVVVVAALLVAYAARLHPGRLTKIISRVAGLGYAVPGSVIAIAILDPFAWFDNNVLDPAFDTGLLLSSGVVIMAFAYAVRFLAPGLGTIEAGLGTIPPRLDDAGRSLGRSPGWILTAVHLPLLLPSLLTAALVIAVDVLKELPASLILADFNTTTLAIHVYQAVANESLKGAAWPALLIVLAGCAPVLVLTIAIHRRRYT